MWLSDLDAQLALPDDQDPRPSMTRASNGVAGRTPCSAQSSAARRTSSALLFARTCEYTAGPGAIRVFGLNLS